MKKYIILALSIVLCACIPVEPSTDTAAPSLSFTPSDEPSVTLTPSLSPSPTLTFTATENQVDTATATQFFNTPTAIIGNPTSPGIKIATPLGSTTGYFVPNRDMNVRVCPYTYCDVVGSLTTSVAVRFYSLQVHSNGDEWLSLDEAGSKWAAYKIGTTIYGVTQ